MTTLELIAIDGYLSTVFFSLSADLLEAVCSQTTVSSFSLTHGKNDLDAYIFFPAILR